MDNIISQISENPRSTPVKVYLWEKTPVGFPGCRVFYGAEGCKLVMGEWSVIRPILTACADQIADYCIEGDRRQSAVPLLDILDLPARIEPGAILRSGVQIGNRAVIMMGAILNIGAVVGDRTMVDMGAVLGGRATVGQDCHIGAGAVLAGTIEPASAKPVVIGDRVLIGANAVVLEGVQVGHDAVVAAGAVVTGDVEPYSVVAGCPARHIKYKDSKTAGKTALTDGLR